MKIKHLTETDKCKHEYIIYSDNLCSTFNIVRSLFNPDYLYAAKLSPKTVSEGRGSAYFFTYEEIGYVLRHFKRGGLIALISDSRYIWFGLRLTRAYREFALLSFMQSIGLPVPGPFAARVQRSGLIYTADLITCKIDKARSLAELSSLSAHKRWFEIGKTIRLFHNSFIYHADLNAHNILLTEQCVYLIDFDKGKKKSSFMSQSWKKSNLLRLQRSLVKLQQVDGINFIDDNWQELLDGYNTQLT